MTTRTLAAATVAAAALLASSLAAAAPAAAESEAVADRRGDTVSFGMGLRGLNPPPAKRADIVRTVGEHESRRVTLRITVADLGGGGTSVQGRVATNEATYTFSAFRSNGTLETALIRDDVGDVGCADFRVAFQPRRDTIVMSAPRTCLSLPTWVRFGAWVNAWEDGVQRLDDARRNGDGDEPIRIGRKRLRHN